MRSAWQWLIGSGIPADPDDLIAVRQRRSEVQRLEDAGVRLPIPVVRPYPDSAAFSYDQAVALAYADVERYGEPA